MTIAKKHSKALKIKYDTLNIQEYFTDNRFSIKEKLILFKLRSSMDDVKLNFSSMHSDTTCELCTDGVPQDTSHLLFCRALLEKCPELYNDTAVEYNHIFSGTNDQLRAAKLFLKVFKTKESLTE